MNPDPFADALRQLPHGPEFRFLDRLLALNPGRTGAAEYCVPRDAPFLRGHFPGNPILPGVLLIEAAAQLAGVVAQSDPAHEPLSDLKLTAVRGAKILGSAEPGETIRLETAIQTRMGNLVHARVQATVAGRLVLQAELILGGGNKPKL